MKLSVVALMSFVLLQSLFSQKTTERNFKPCFDRYGVEGCFVLYEPSGNQYIKYNSVRCDSGFIPASTFKIPNSLIALQEKIVRDINEIIPWNGHQWLVTEWNQNQTLKTAVKYSCVWVFVGFAEKIGIEKYQQYINAFDYGNKDLTGPPTRFWLSGPFRISADQQIDFLNRFYHYQLPSISKQNIDIVKNCILLEQGNDYTLSGKTGTGILPGNMYVMWLVGYIEKNHKPWFYAMNFTTDDISRTRNARLEITKSILHELNLID